MLKFLTLGAVLRCGHKGKINTKARQTYVTIDGVPVLIDNDPEGCSISRCPNVVTPNKPCTLTLAVSKGYSAFISIDGHEVCLETVEGFTDGTPPGLVKYSVMSPGQDFVSEN
jgi:hypothetical protein